MKAQRALEMRSVLLVYGAFCLLAAGLDWWSRGHPFAAFFNSKSAGPAAYSMGLCFLVLSFGLSVLICRWSRAGTELERSLQQILTPLSYFQILLLSIVSGYIEEWFFRGVLLQQFGLILSSIVFGLAHFLPGAHVWLWSLWAMASGFALGLIYEFSGSLGLVATIHILLNFLWLFRLNWRAHRAATSPRPRY